MARGTIKYVYILKTKINKKPHFKENSKYQ